MFTDHELTKIGDLVRAQATMWHKLWLSPLITDEVRDEAMREKDQWIELYSKVRRIQRDLQGQEVQA